MNDLTRLQNKLIERNGNTVQTKNKLSALDKYVIFSFANIIIFTIIALIYQFLTSEELSSTLIISFFGVFGGELLLLAMIKRLKLKKEDTNE